MIFGQLFKRKQEDSAAEADKEDVALSQQYRGVAVSPADRSAKQSKSVKRNTALYGGGKKRRSNRVVHTKRSFHQSVRRDSGESVNVYDVIERPVVTEKAANQSENGVYTFIVRYDADKHSVADAVETIYGVRPKKVRTAKRPSKRKRVRIPGREQGYGMTAQKKKVYVFLREGDTISLS